MSDDKIMNRRRFFRAGLAELFNLRPLGKAVAPLEELARQLGRLEEPGHRHAAPEAPVEIRRPSNTVSYSAAGARDDVSDGPEDPDHWIRPPGARIEREFLDICSKCGNCVHACPVQAIHLDNSGALGKGAPYIDPDTAGCVMCEGLQCISHCPSSALMQITAEQVDIGLAQWHDTTCLRTAVGEQCTMCVDHCPVGSAAIEVAENRIVVHESHCTGCGSCQHNCPTSPKSITITPKSRRTTNAEEN
ncbi:MAG TPA: 4Fe-4S dicluster domain-containing protein [Tepidisphaeraceae bacterium]|nr:4Fe-4S dicluster domain-containing protein [Tepidisphaeraceae bacterium]